LLESSALPFREVHHSPTRASEESAKPRGEDIAIGGKAILMKVGEEYKLFFLSAAKKIASPQISHLGVNKFRFASPEELQGFTGLVPGSVPPFGKPILPFDLYVDFSITANEKIAFNAGSLATAIIMNCRDYLGRVSAEVFDFAT
jgi:Ala-tRNA(Pro) deacylase